MNVLKQISTYRDNQSFSIGNIGGLILLLGHIVFTGFDVIVQKRPFEPHTFGMGAAMILGGMAGHQHYTDATESSKLNS